jgi:hypothetical protein
MANDLEKFNNWMSANSANALGAIAGAVELFKVLRPTAAARQVPVQALLIGDPVADRAITDAVGIGAIAGRNSVSVDDILTAANLLKGVALMVTALV